MYIGIVMIPLISSIGSGLLIEAGMLGTISIGITALLFIVIGYRVIAEDTAVTEGITALLSWIIGYRVIAEDTVIYTGLIGYRVIAEDTVIYTGLIGRWIESGITALLSWIIGYRVIAEDTARTSGILSPWEIGYKAIAEGRATDEWIEKGLGTRSFSELIDLEERISGLELKVESLSKRIELLEQQLNNSSKASTKLTSTEGTWHRHKNEMKAYLLEHKHLTYKEIVQHFMDVYGVAPGVRTMKRWVEVNKLSNRKLPKW